jgi:D-arginine dehydrogenase
VVSAGVRADGSLNLSVDVCVIGAGIAGASTAYELAAHADVAVVEQEIQAGHHATGRSASVLSETSGHPLVCALAAASRPFFESPPPGFCEHQLLAERGLLWVGRDGDGSLLDELAVAGRAVAPTVRRLDPGETLARLPGFRPGAVAAGGVLEPDAMAIDTAALLAGFIAGLRRRGGTLITSAEAITLQPHGRQWVVHAGTHTVRTAHVVDAAGAWGDVVATRAGVRPLGLQPKRRTAALVPAPDRVAAWPLVMDVAGRYYVEPESGGLLVSPADEHDVDPCDARPDELDVAWALEQLSIATDVPVRTVRRAWAGLRTFAPDRAPVVGEDPDAPGFWWLVGQGGAGIKTAPAMAVAIAALLRGRPMPDALVERGVTAAALSPRRLR